MLLLGENSTSSNNNTNSNNNNNTNSNNFDSRNVYESDDDETAIILAVSVPFFTAMVARASEVVATSSSSVGVPLRPAISSFNKLGQTL